MLNLWLSGPEVPAVGPVENTCRADSHTRIEVSNFVLRDDCFPRIRLVLTSSVFL